MKLKLESLPAADAEAKFLDRFARLSKAADRASARPVGKPDT